MKREKEHHALEERNRRNTEKEGKKPAKRAEGKLYGKKEGSHLIKKRSSTGCLERGGKIRSGTALEKKARDERKGKHHSYNSG